MVQRGRGREGEGEGERERETEAPKASFTPLDSAIAVLVWYLAEREIE